MNNQMYPLKVLCTSDNYSGNPILTIAEGIRHSRSMEDIEYYNNPVDTEDSGGACIAALAAATACCLSMRNLRFYNCKEHFTPA